MWRMSYESWPYRAQKISEPHFRRFAIEKIVYRSLCIQPKLLDKEKHTLNEPL